MVAPPLRRLPQTACPHMPWHSIRPATVFCLWRMAASVLLTLQTLAMHQWQTTFPQVRMRLSRSWVVGVHAVITQGVAVDACRCCLCGCVYRSGTLHVSPVSVTVPSWGTSVRREGDTVTLDRPVTVTVVPASQAAHAGRNIVSYTLTWGRSFLKPLRGGDAAAAGGGGVLPHVFDASEVDAGEHGGSHLHFVLPEGTRVPSEATHLLACVLRMCGRTYGS